MSLQAALHARRIGRCADRVVDHLVERGFGAIRLKAGAETDGIRFGMAILTIGEEVHDAVAHRLGLADTWCFIDHITREYVDQVAAMNAATALAPLVRETW